MKSLVIFTESGRTYTFHGITVVTDNESFLTFTYKAMSDGKTKKATFYKNRIVGYSLY